ncbi:Phage-related protein [Fructobacillus fructosus]|uniref:tape measure protein n=1 Tax=Fructobacillus fructosus TaxID=1631 RepID=UPI002D9F65AF|nr:Phage-related protein [Fructobacillus fructosus]
MAKIVNEMANKLSLDTTSATKTLKDFTNEVKKSTNEWKIQESQMKASGDQLGASKAKYEGLTTAVEKQTTKVDSLKQALANTNTSTEKGQKLQGYLTAELAKAERQLNSYNGQLEKATQSYKYQSSGMAKLNEDIKHNTDLTEANVKQLKAEGKEHEANKVKLAGLTKNRESLNSILKIQQAELEKLTSSGNKNSEAYKKQELRVAQMKAKIAEANSEIKTMNGRGIKINTSGMDKVNERLAKMNERVNKTNHMFAKMLGANIAAAGITSALSSVQSHITGVISAGSEYNKTMQNISVGFDTFTNGNKELSKQLTDNVKKIRETSGYTESVGAAMTKTAYGITKNKEETEKLTGSLGNLGRAYGKNDEDMGAAVKMLSQMSSTGKITSGSISKMDKQFKGFGDQLAKTMNISRDQLNDFASKGKVSMNDVKNAMNDLSKTKPLALDNYYKTVDGFTNHFKSRYQILSGEITKGFFSNSNAMLASLSKSLDGKQVDTAFNKFGDAVNKSANTIFSAFSKSFGKKGENPVVTFANAASTGVEKLANFIAAHAKDIQNFFKAVAGAAKIAGATMGVGLKVAIPTLSAIGSLATKHKTTFKVLAGTVVALGVAFKGTLAVMKGFTIINSGVKSFKALSAAIKSSTIAQKAFNLASKANPIGLIVTAIGALVAGVILAYNKIKPFHKFVDNMGKSIVKVFKGVIDFFKKDWKQIALFMVNPIAGGIALLYKHFKPFRQFVDGIGKFFKNVFKSMADGVKSAMDNIGKFINSAVKLWQKIFKAELDIISSVFKFVFDGIKGIIKTVMKTIYNVISSVLETISNVWNSIWNGVSSFFGNIWKGMSKFVSNTIKGIHNTISNVLDSISSTWNGMWRGLSNFFGDIWKDIKGFAQDGINGVLNIINSGIDAIDSVWKFFTGHETSVHHLKPVKFERGGVVETRMSMINDGKGENWKELIQLPDGQLKMSNKRDHVLPLPVGTRVYNGDQTKQIMKAAGVTKYADGGIIGGVVNAAKGATDWTVKTAKGAGEWVGDKFEKVTEFLKDPLKNVTDLIVKSTKGMFDGLHSFGDMAHGVFDNLYKPIADWFKKGLEKVKDSLGRNAPGGSGVERWRDQVKDALKENGMSTESWAVNKILKQISTESSGNEKAVQGGYTDINTKTGDLAKGLMQTISATFNRYAFPGHKNIFNGYDNLLAAIAYIKNRYGMNMSGIGEGHGYANGGLVSRHQIAQIAEGNKPEMIIPLDSMKSARGFELLGKTAVAMAARDGQTGQNTKDNSEVVGKLDQMITLLSMILGVNKEQLAGNSNNSSLLGLYNQMSQDNNIRKYQQGGVNA